MCGTVCVECVNSIGDLDIYFLSSHTWLGQITCALINLLLSWHPHPVNHTDPALSKQRTQTYYRDTFATFFPVNLIYPEHSYTTLAVIYPKAMSCCSFHTLQKDFILTLWTCRHINRHFGILVCSFKLQWPWHIYALKHAKLMMMMKKESTTLCILNVAVCISNAGD